MPEGEKKRSFISFEEAQSLLEDRLTSLELHAVCQSKTISETPTWLFEVRSGLNKPLILKSRSSGRRPMIARTPSGVYGVALELGFKSVNFQII